MRAKKSRPGADGDQPAQILARHDCAMPGSTRRLDSESRAARILARVRAIPEGFVRTYGDIEPGAPRMVGAVLAALEQEDVPWHRVVRSNGTVAKGEEQLRRLRGEGVPIRRGRVDLRAARLPPEAY
jgi:alkylated DNA nucleotide flippase Atl1